MKKLHLLFEQGFHEETTFTFEQGFNEETTFTSQHLGEKLVKQFGDQIDIDSGNKRRGNIVYKKGMDIEEVVRNAFDLNKQSSTQLRNVAFELRKNILDLNPHLKTKSK